MGKLVKIHSFPFPKEVMSLSKNAENWQIYNMSIQIYFFGDQHHTKNQGNWVNNTDV